MQLVQHQVEASSMFVENDGGIAWIAPGEGKTRIALNVFALLQIKYKWKPPCVCIVVARPAAFHDWEAEVLKVGLDWFVHPFTPEDDIISTDQPTIWLVSCGMLTKVLSAIRYNKRYVKFVVIDELYLYSNPRVARSRSASHLRSCCKNRILGLSGTIMPAKDNTSIWGQSTVIGIHTLLARNLTAFRGRYQSFFTATFGKIKSNKKGSEIAIMQKLRSRVFVHFPKDRVLKTKFTEIPATPQQNRLIDKLKEEYYIEHKGAVIELRSALALSIKIRKIANGWLDETETGKIVSVQTNKLAALKQSVEEVLASGAKCLVWCYFRHEIELVKKFLGIPCLTLVGGKPFNIALWQKGKINLVIASQSCGSSINYFKDVAYVKYFSLGYKWLDLQQSMFRTTRKDSNHNGCHYEFFLVRGTLDQHTYDCASNSGKTELDFIRAKGFTSWLQVNRNSHPSV